MHTNVTALQHDHLTVQIALCLKHKRNTSSSWLAKTALALALLLSTSMGSSRSTMSSGTLRGTRCLSSWRTA